MPSAASIICNPLGGKLLYLPRISGKHGWIFYCSAWLLGRKAIGHQAFAEGLREPRVYSDFSPFQPEGEITAKIQIPMAQIQRAEEWKFADVQTALASLTSLSPSGHS